MDSFEHEEDESMMERRIANLEAVLVDVRMF